MMEPEWDYVVAANSLLHGSKATKHGNTPLNVERAMYKGIVSLHLSAFPPPSDSVSHKL